MLSGSFQGCMGKGAGAPKSHGLSPHLIRGDSPHWPKTRTQTPEGAHYLSFGPPSPPAKDLQKSIKFQHRFLIDFWSQNDPKIDPQSHQKSIQKPVQDPTTFLDRILIKFHREGGQIFCKTAEFLAPTQSEPQPTTEKDKGGKEQELDTKDIPNLSEQDVKIYLVNPRDNKPSLLELSDIYREQVVLQRAAVKRVAIIQKEMHKLVEDRMKELSAHDMEVWIFDTKRNPQVTRGRQEQENAARKREEDVMDLELDFLAPYLQRFPDVNSLSKAQALGIQFLPK